MLFKIVENREEENEKVIDRIIEKPDFGAALGFFINNYHDSPYQGVSIDLKNSTASIDIGYYTDYDTDTVLMPADDTDYMGKKTPYYE